MRKPDPEDVLDWCLALAGGVIMVSLAFAVAATLILMIWKGYTQ